MSFGPIGEFDLKSYQFYISHADKHKYILGSIHNNVIENGESPWINKLKDITSEFRFLDVGSGPGHLTSSVLKALFHARGIGDDSTEGIHSPGIVAYCVEPHEEAMNLLKEGLYSEGIDELIDIKFIKKKIEPLFDQDFSSGSIPNFDFILCSHTLYYIEDWPRLMDDFIRCLVPGGQLCIVLLSRDTELLRLRDQLIPKLKSNPLVRLRFGEDVENCLQHEKIPYIMEIKESQVTFSPEETEAFFRSSSEEIDPVTNILGFLFGYSPLDLKCEVFPTIREFVEGRIQDKKLSLPYKDKIFWITKKREIKKKTVLI